MHRYGLIADDHRYRGHRLGHDEEERAALHEHRAECGDEPTDPCISQHHPLIVRSSNQSPIGLHMPHAFAYVVAAPEEQPIINAAHDPVAQRTYPAQFHLDIALLQRHVQQAWHHDNCDERRASENVYVQGDPLDGRRLGRMWPSSDRHQEPTSQLETVIVVVLVRELCARCYTLEARHHFAEARDALMDNIPLRVVAGLFKRAPARISGAMNRQADVFAEQDISASPDRLLFVEISY